MSFDSDPRDEVSAEEYYGEMEIARLRELNAELLSALKGVTERLKVIGYSDLSQGLVAIGELAIRHAEGTPDEDIDLKTAIAKAEKLRS